jgi:hypothetical protein
MSGSRPKWTAEQDAELRARWGSGASILTIGRALLRTKNAVAGRVHRLGLVKRGSPIAGLRGAAAVRVAKAPRVFKGPLNRVEGGARAFAEARAAPAKQRIIAPRAMPVARPVPAINPNRFCRFIAGEPAGLATLYCEAPCRAGSSYCPDHHAVCFLPWTDRRAPIAVARRAA